MSRNPALNYSVPYRNILVIVSIIKKWGSKSEFVTKVEGYIAILMQSKAVTDSLAIISKVIA